MTYNDTVGAISTNNPVIKINHLLWRKLSYFIKEPGDLETFEQ